MSWFALTAARRSFASCDRAARRTAVHGVVASRQQLVLDHSVGFLTKVLKQADRVGLAELVEDGVVPNGQGGRAAVGGGPVDVVAADVPQVVDVVVLNQALSGSNAGFCVVDVRSILTFCESP